MCFSPGIHIQILFHILTLWVVFSSGYALPLVHVLLAFSDISLSYELW